MKIVEHNKHSLFQ